MTAIATNTPTTDAALRESAVVVYGAYGHTARFVVAELHRRGRTVILSGRHEERLREFGGRYPDAPIRVADVADPAALDRAFAGAAAVINCAGPFSATTLPVADAAIRAGAHYLDVSAEQAATATLFDTRGEQATAAGLVLAPSFAFYGALGDLLATAALGGRSEADEITIAFGLDSWLPTEGSRLTGRTNAGRHLVFTGGRLRPFSYSREQSEWRFPAPMGALAVTEFATADQVTIPRHLRVPEVRAVMNLAPLRDVADASTPNPSPAPADALGRSAQTFLVEVVVRTGDREHRAVAGGNDIYAVTAPLVVEAAERLPTGRHTTTGVLAAGEAFDAAEFLRALTPDHLTRLELPSAAAERHTEDAEHRTTIAGAAR
ncbi:saccharopine dehydrogenase family protein [Embleya hyalina]|uniref:Saccharopine dehydrogenase n=1 Tax=Embleya hyalina TaxID=516124 RepID=A0A401YGL3_9ACTN|nr:saccharopine dehydrogenase NADP-binding domain-containing protein [Embleya hyalina]GCD93700.1 saccharopine dehydrogenase [Embleya hyalina]